MGNKLFIAMAIFLIVTGGSGFSYDASLWNIVWGGIGCFALYYSTRDYLLEKKE